MTKNAISTILKTAAITLTFITSPTIAAPTYQFTDLGTLGGNHIKSAAFAINDRGQVVGKSIINNSQSRAFIYDTTNGMQNLGTLGGSSSEAIDINNNGQIVGSSRNSNNATHAFIYDASNGMKDIGTLGGQYSIARAINDKGQVVGNSVNGNNRDHAFLY